MRFYQSEILSLFLSFLKIVYMCVCVWIGYVHLCTVVLIAPERDAGSPGSGVAEDCDSPSVGTRK